MKLATLDLATDDSGGDVSVEDRTDSGEREPAGDGPGET